jgi:hypothetical protein
MQATATPESAAARATVWALAHPAEMGWLVDNMVSNSFAASLAADVSNFGELSAGQLNAVRNNLERSRSAAATRATAPTITTAQIEALFDTARGNGVKKPAMRLDEFVFKAAGQDSRNVGGIYVTTTVHDDSVYLGKVLGGKFLKTDACTDDQQKRILAVASSPADAAKAYGQRTGNCSICGRELTAEESIERFIGPICFANFGL